MKRDDVLDSVKKTICNDRQDVHGNPEDTHSHIAHLWNNYMQARGVFATQYGYITPQDVAVMMCLFKIARHAVNPTHTDNLHDMIGYGAIAMEIGNECT